MNGPEALFPVARMEHDADGTHRLELRGELDHETVDDLLDTLRTLLARLSAGETVVIDCASLEFCDSSGLAAFLMAQREAEARDSAIVLRGQPDFLRNLLDLTGTSGLFRTTGQPADPGDGDGSGGAGRPRPGTAAYGGAFLVWDGAVPVVRLYGEIDAESVDEVEFVLDKAADAAPDGMSIDLAELEFADSTLLHLLLTVRERAAVRFVGPPRPGVRLLFEAAGLLAAFGFAESGDHADRAVPAS